MSHAILFISAAQVDFAHKNYKNGFEESGAFALKGWKSSEELTLTCNVGPGNELPIIIGLGVQFFNAVNGDLYQMEQGAFGIVGVY